MKLVLFAAALTLGSAALAQSNSAPETDARGIPVVSDAAVAPSGANQTVQVQAGARVVPAPNQSAVFTTQASTKTYPACAKGQTDSCVQNYERGGAGTRTRARARRR